MVMKRDYAYEGGEEILKETLSVRSHQEREEDGLDILDKIRTVTHLEINYVLLLFYFISDASSV